jgi:endoglucanase
MKLLKKLTETPGVTGYEDAVRAIVKTELARYCDTVTTDSMGNVIGLKKAKFPKGAKRPKKVRRVMLAAHMDEIGFIVRHVDEKTGFLRIQPLGGFDAKTLIAKRVMVHGRKKCRGVIGTKPVHIMSDEEKKKLPSLDDLFVDLGLPAKAVKKNVAVGDMVSLEQTFLDLGDAVTAKALDDRVGVYVMLEALRRMKKCSVDIYAVGSVQEEVGLRGALVSAFGVEPDIGIALDITIACDLPGVGEAKQVTRMGQGVAIKIMDSASISNPKLVKRFRKLAADRGIKHQMEILPRGGTDGGAMQRARGGAAVITLSIPTRYAHSVVEMASKKDIEAAIKLLAAFLEVAHEGTYIL